MRFVWPLALPFFITRDFYFKDSLYVGGQHAAIDIIAQSRPTDGDPVRAIADGTAYSSPINDYYSGWNVYVEHADGWRSGYRHFRNQILPVNQPIPVSQGTVLGYADSTGRVTGPHLHFDLWNHEKKSPEAFAKVGWWAHDPELYLGVESENDMPITNAEWQQIATADENITKQVNALTSDVLAVVDALDKRLDALEGGGGSDVAATIAELRRRLES